MAEQDELKLRNEPDGSVLVGGDDTPPPKKEEEDNEDHSDKAGALASTDDSHEEDEPAKDNETADEAEERRRRNRERRAENKQNRKNYIESLKREISARDEILQQMNERLNTVERRSQGADVAMVDAELQKTNEAYNYFKQVHADAVTRADGAAATDAQERMFQAMRRAEQLQGIKEASSKPRVPQAAPLDPRLKMHAEQWLERNKWYDPNGSDMDSRVAYTIDSELAREGWDPKTEAYWKELDARVEKYLPHKAKRVYNPSQSNPGSSQRVPVAGSGRETSSSGNGGYRLSADRVQAIKDAGNWDDPVQRAKAIKYYQDYDKMEGAR